MSDELKRGQCPADRIWTSGPCFDRRGHVWHATCWTKQVEADLAALREAAQGDGPPTASLWLSEDRALALEAALKGVMRNQARLLEAWAQGERYDEDSDVVAELVASRDAGKVALGYPQPRFSQRPGDGRS
jgi:hypothetical protein